MTIPLIAGLIVVLITLFIGLSWKRPKSVHDDAKRRSVACKRCGAQIGIKNVKVGQELSLRCESCEARTIYMATDVIIR